MNELRKLHVWVLDQLADCQRPQFFEGDEEAHMKGMEMAYENMLFQINKMLNGDKDWEDAK